MTAKPIPRIEMGNGFWPRLVDALKAEAKPVGAFGGVTCYASKLVPDNMAVMIDDDGNSHIIDMRTDEEREHLASLRAREE